MHTDSRLFLLLLPRFDRERYVAMLAHDTAWISSDVSKRGAGLFCLHDYHPRSERVVCRWILLPASSIQDIGCDFQTIKSVGSPHVRNSGLISIGITASTTTAISGACANKRHSSDCIRRHVYDRLLTSQSLSLPWLRIQPFIKAICGNSIKSLLRMSSFAPGLRVPICYMYTY